MIVRREALDLSERRAMSEAIAARLGAMALFEEARAIGLYRAVRGEVETDLLIERCFREGRKVAVPVVRRDERRLLFSWISRETSLDLLVMPGVAFTEDGSRLGYGGGYYDRLLREAARRPVTVLLAFEMQGVPELPRGDHDVKVDWIVTETRTLNTGESVNG
ncbi:MAG: 5-formyltetrahydrofolate cyclo-ligase [Nitrospirae bacterium]|nr:5-formyltetrahydrofolate cyclo-ligase [Nitrospirota bacterium]